MIDFLFSALAIAMVLITGFAVLALGLMASHRPIKDLRGDGLDFTGLPEGLPDMPRQTYPARDGSPLPLRHFPCAGGLVIRAANGALKGQLDHAILLAPHLKHNAPTAQANAQWARPLTPRIVGLMLYNMARDPDHNALTAIQFCFPDAVLNGRLGHTATRSYSYRMMVGFNPRTDYLSDIKALPPFPLIAGDHDEAFRSEYYEPTIRSATDRGRYHLLKGLGHSSVVHAPETYALIKQALA